MTDSLPDFRERFDSLDAPPQAGEANGDARLDKNSPTYYRAIGKLGGAANAAGHGREFYGAIGRKGGAAVKAKYGSDYYCAIARKRWAKRETDNS